MTLLLRNEPIINLWVLFAVIGISGMIILVIYVVGSKLHAKFLTETLNVSVLAAHLLDASSSYIGIDLLGYHGKHVIEGSRVYRLRSRNVPTQTWYHHARAVSIGYYL
jgi:uncharacterized membrane protein